MKDLALLILRLGTGGLLAGHGAQKLFGWFGGPGPEGAGRYLESLGLRPGRRWAIMAGLGEFVGGLLTALGLFHPIGPLAITAVMTTATFKGHAGKPIWASAGGAELPVTNILIAVALLLAGPGRFSLDRALGVQVPAGVLGVVTALLVGGTGLAITQQPVEAPAKSATT